MCYMLYYMLDYMLAGFAWWGATASSSGVVEEASMVSTESGYLAVSQPLWKLDAKGMMVLGGGIKRFSMDVGVNKGVATRRWL